MPAARARRSPGATDRSEMTIEMIASSCRAATASMIDCRLLPRPEMRRATRRTGGWRRYARVSNSRGGIRRSVSTVPRRPRGATSGQTTTHVRRWHAYRGTSGTGSVYQGRHKSIAIESDSHLLTACRCVERSPLRGSFVHRAEIALVEQVETLQSLRRGISSSVADSNPCRLARANQRTVGYGQARTATPAPPRVRDPVPLTDTVRLGRRTPRSPGASRWAHRRPRAD